MIQPSRSATGPSRCAASVDMRQGYRWLEISLLRPFSALAMDSGPQDDYHSYLSWLAMAPPAFGSGITSSLLAMIRGISHRVRGHRRTADKGLGYRLHPDRRALRNGDCDSSCRDRPDESVSGGACT